MADDNEKDEPKVKAEDNSIGIGRFSVGGDLSGKVQIATGDIVTHEHYEEATAAKTEKEFEINELEELRVSLFEKMETLRSQCRVPSEREKAYHLKALELNEGRYLLGRTEALSQLIRRIDSKPSTFMVGRGGMGRTSLLQAGLMPALLQQGHLPVLVSLSQELLELTIKRNILSRVESTTYLKRLNLAKFLEHTARCLPPEKRLVILLDSFENAFDSTTVDPLRDFETEWRLAQSNRKLRWLFSIDQGFTTRLAPFHPDDFLEVSALDRTRPGARSSILIRAT